MYNVVCFGHLTAHMSILPCVFRHLTDHTPYIHHVIYRWIDIDIDIIHNMTYMI